MFSRSSKELCVWFELRIKGLKIPFTLFQKNALILMITLIIHDWYIIINEYLHYIFIFETVSDYRKQLTLHSKSTFCQFTYCLGIEHLIVAIFLHYDLQVVLLEYLKNTFLNSNRQKHSLTKTNTEHIKIKSDSK